MQKEVQSGHPHELHICRRAPRISHMLFVDDTLIFMEATENLAEVVKTSPQCMRKALDNWLTWQNVPWFLVLCALTHNRRR
jgi:hypothetical protein